MSDSPIRGRMLARIAAPGISLVALIVLIGLAGAPAAEPRELPLHTDEIELAAYQVASGKVFRPVPWATPIAGGYQLTGRFGDTGRWASAHTGLDFAAPAGTRVRAVAGGTVTETGYDGAYGNKVVVTRTDGTEIWFAHLSTTVVRVGQQVAPGDLIGGVGSTGHSTGDHLHLEIRPGGGDPVDPHAYLAARGAL